MAACIGVRIGWRCTDEPERNAQREGPEPLEGKEQPLLRGLRSGRFGRDSRGRSERGQRHQGPLLRIGFDYAKDSIQNDDGVYVPVRTESDRTTN